MKIGGFNFTPGSSLKRSSQTPSPASSGDQVQLSGGDLSAKKGGEESGLRQVGKGIAKASIIAGGIALGGLSALGASSIGAGIGLLSLSLGLLATLSDNQKLKTMGYLLMLGPVAAGTGVLGAIGTGLSVGFGVSLAGQYGSDAHQLANALLDK
ncbi:hypothetical protein JST97_29415 [bacterium]|nr:hypothetical protein [bacterium]